MLKIYLPISILILLSVSCATFYETPRSSSTLGQSNGWVSLWLPFAPIRWKQSYNHTILKSPRWRSDCQPDCPQIDIWQYQYQNLTSTNPISTQQKFWKVPHEARIIAFTLFGENNLYYDGLIDHLDSFQHVKKINHIPDNELWGHETFTIRVYVAKRNPKNSHLGPLKNATRPDIIQKLLKRGCEIVFVDNGLSAVGKDATFWRFMVADEVMPENQTIRYLVRDADWLFTAAEAYAVADWLDTDLEFHRMNLVAVCMGPLVASFWGGKHTGKSRFTNLKTTMELFPYRMEYGDDELFTRDILWPRMKHSGSVLTSIHPRDFRSYFANPYVGSCEEPTQSYCDTIRPNGTCIDKNVPKEIDYPYIKLGMRQSLKDFESLPEVFDIQTETNAGQRVLRLLSVNTTIQIRN